MVISLLSTLGDSAALQIVGAVNAYSAILAEKAGFKALYLSGGGVAAASFGLPDLGVTTMTELFEDARRITGVTKSPLLVDADTGFGSGLSIARTIKEAQRAGVSSVHIEDQVVEKRCGHRPGKVIVSTIEMIDRIKAAVDARYDANFSIMARTDAYGIEGLNGAISRALHYVEAGADMIFAEAMTSLDDYKRFTNELDVPVLANMTEFGQTPLFSKSELEQVGIKFILYPLSAFRAMSQAAFSVYQSILENGHQREVLPLMQTRDELYAMLKYHEFETKMDRVLKHQATSETEGKKL